MIDEQVVHLLVVDLEVAAAHEESFALLAVIDTSKNVSEAIGNDPPQLRVLRNTHHGVSFAAASLTVREDCAIIALEHAFNQTERALIIDSRLF